jgi:hypothetical protein
MIEHDPSGSMIARVFFTANPSVYTPIHESIRKLEMAVESADSQKAVGAGCRTLDESPRIRLHELDPRHALVFLVRKQLVSYRV